MPGTDRLRLTKADASAVAVTHSHRAAVVSDPHPLRVSCSGLLCVRSESEASDWGEAVAHPKRPHCSPILPAAVLHLTPQTRGAGRDDGWGQTLGSVTG